MRMENSSSVSPSRRELQVERNSMKEKPQKLVSDFSTLHASFVRSIIKVNTVATSIETTMKIPKNPTDCQSAFAETGG